MQPPKLIWIVVASSLLSSVLYAPASYAQSPVVVSASSEPLIFELPNTPHLAQQLNPYTTAKLATPAQHLDRGLAYPLWLSDANFIVKTRAGQRQSVVVEAKRSNPDLTTDLLLALNNKGVRSLEASTLIFDKIHTFASAAPMPGANQAAQPDLASGFANALKSTKPLDFLALASTPQNVALTDSSLNDSVSTERTETSPSKQGPRQTQSDRSRIENHAHVRSVVTSHMNVAKPSSAPVTFPAGTASQAMPDKIFQTPPPATPLASSLPASTISAITPPTRPLPKALLSEPSWLDNWPFLAGAAIGLLLLAYLVTRLLKKRAKPVDFEPTSSPPEQVTSTVFGLSDEEADAMHKKWLSDQLLSKNNK